MFKREISPPSLLLTLRSSMLFSAPLNFLSSDFTKNVDPPAERKVISLITIHLVQGFELGIRDHEVCGD